MERAIEDGPGIYRIRNIITDTDYIGASTFPCSIRWQQHRSALDAGTHGNPKLQQDWIEYGAAAFSFEVIEHLATGLAGRELYWIQRTLEERNCYNVVLPTPERTVKLDQLLTLGEAAKIAGLHRTTIDHWIVSGRLRAATLPALTKRKGVRRYILSSDLEKFLAEGQPLARIRKKG